jgi:putative spermidine/putrescine transport system substrate-binding protein
MTMLVVQGLRRYGYYDEAARVAEANCRMVFDTLEKTSHFREFYNSLNGQPYGVPHGRGPNLLMYNTEAVTPAPTTWDDIWEGGSRYAGKISIYDSSIFIADAALHLMVKRPDLGIKNPYQLNDAQFAEGKGARLHREIAVHRPGRR